MLANGSSWKPNPFVERSQALCVYGCSPKQKGVRSLCHVTANVARPGMFQYFHLHHWASVCIHKLHKQQRRVVCPLHVCKNARKPNHMVFMDTWTATSDKKGMSKEPKVKETALPEYRVWWNSMHYTWPCTRKKQQTQSRRCDLHICCNCD